jgi:hypothetical protein
VFESEETMGWKNILSYISSVWLKKRERDAKQKVHILYKDNVSAIKNFIASY